MLATKPMPQASCSCAGSYRPCTGGKPLFVFQRCRKDPSSLYLVRRSPHITGLVSCRRASSESATLNELLKRALRPVYLFVTAVRGEKYNSGTSQVRHAGRRMWAAEAD